MEWVGQERAGDCSTLASWALGAGRGTALSCQSSSTEEAQGGCDAWARVLSAGCNEGLQCRA